MIRILMLTSEDFIDPPPANQWKWAAKLKSGRDLQVLCQDAEIVVYNGNVALNRYGEINVPFSLDMVQDRQ
ncbi:hypothetical protein GVX81_02665 [[Haemophilus] felis]|uniref:Uncharacterized protein n=1 Tax=[Haemophilus] felis TaxID=123822 RepID=A0A1T0B1X2_9PAST|nr:hypothetical protein [[Haemophilus] felis]NBI40208.1 hypothetical protein [[Haemophilus] felis]OOS04125.1 hypothetical protein B0188_05515 [[Haemophilus] felis]